MSPASCASASSPDRDARRRHRASTSGSARPGIDHAPDESRSSAAWRNPARNSLDGRADVVVPAGIEPARGHEPDGLGPRRAIDVCGRRRQPSGRTTPRVRGWYPPASRAASMPRCIRRPYGRIREVRRMGCEVAGSMLEGRSICSRRRDRCQREPGTDADTMVGVGLGEPDGSSRGPSADVPLAEHQPDLRPEVLGPGRGARADRGRRRRRPRHRSAAMSPRRRRPPRHALCPFARRTTYCH